uniref:Uncharacterized protein n=1 Tax=Ditylenchus dipsaci TaxID=166011 RepID=A0A915EIX7_9BILA
MRMSKRSSMHARSFRKTANTTPSSTISLLRMMSVPRREGCMGNYYSCGAYKGTATAALIPSPVGSTPDESNLVVGSIRVPIDHDPVMHCCSVRLKNSPVEELAVKEYV